MKYNYEIHITVESCGVDYFKKYCAEDGLKPLLIDLRHDGATIGNQLMCSKRLYTDDYSEVFDSVLKINNKLLSQYLKVTRIKIETDIDNFIINFHKNSYFECHVPVQVKNDADYNKITKLDDFHLSKNAFKITDDYQVYFLTSRKSRRDALNNSLQTLILYLNDNKDNTLHILSKN
jgi:hypothetical protein